MFKELDTNLKAINGEVSKLQTAVEHIDKAKTAAQKAVETADNMQKAFNEHLTDVTKNVESILKPHKELIKATEELAKTINAVNFPERLDKQEKEIKLLKILLFVSIGISVISLIMQFVIK